MLLAAATRARRARLFLDRPRHVGQGPSHRGRLARAVAADGGEIVCEPSIIARIAPDEVPYPEPRPRRPRVAAAAGRSLPVDSCRTSAIIDSVAAEHGVSAQLVHAVIQVESDYQERARSPKGAMGLMQLMPETARQLRTSPIPTTPRRTSRPASSTSSRCSTVFRVALALAAYNAGEAAVERFRRHPAVPRNPRLRLADPAASHRPDSAQHVRTVLSDAGLAVGLTVNETADAALQGLGIAIIPSRLMSIADNQLRVAPA